MTQIIQLERLTVSHLKRLPSQAFLHDRKAGYFLHHDAMDYQNSNVLSYTLVVSSGQILGGFGITSCFINKTSTVLARTTHICHVPTQIRREKVLAVAALQASSLARIWGSSLVMVDSKLEEDCAWLGKAGFEEVFPGQHLIHRETIEQAEDIVKPRRGVRSGILVSPGHPAL